jgi:hypothetical protein
MPTTRRARQKTKASGQPASVDFLSGLYNRASCYADRLSPEQLNAIHVPTALEDAIKSWLQAKKDVVLLGNPGDGKTHLLRRLQDVIDRVKAEVVLDATAESDYQRIVRKWKVASDARRPFCLAINQGPLNRLLNEGTTRFAPLDEMRAQSRSLLYYDDPPPIPTKTIVVDLNLRSVLTPDIIHHSLQNLLKPELLDTAADCFADASSDVALNRRALTSTQVAGRLVQLLRAASYSGRHVSMRDLQGFLSYLLFGGRTVNEMRKDPSNRQYRYFNLCFDGTGELFDAVRDVFEPERVTLPEVDEHLWENTGVREGWLFERPPLTPDHLDDAWEQFLTLKRQYYFEHIDGDRLLTIDQEASLASVLAGGLAAVARHLPTVLKAINTFYCPIRDEDGMSLRLWGAQHYDGHSPKVFASCYIISKDKFELQIPKLAPWLTDAIDYSADHLLLTYKGSDGERAKLRIDLGLWRALMLAGRGLPMGLRSPQYSQALRTFLSQLARTEGTPHNIETVFLYNVNTNRLTRVVVDRQNGVYAQS